MFVDEPQADSLVEFPVGQRLILILIHLNAHVHNYIQFHAVNIFCGKERVPCHMYGNSKKRNLDSEGQLHRISHATNRTECAQMFLSQHYLVVEPQAAEFTE